MEIDHYVEKVGCRMKLKQLERFIDPIILERAEEYRKNGHILSIEETSPTVYYAQVQGSELYNVSIEFSKSDNVSFTDCECLYEDTPICKHIAAVLLEIREPTSNEVKAAPKTPKSKSAKLTDHLFKLGKDELIALLIHLSKEIEGVEQELSLKFVDADHNEGLRQYKKIIRDSIKKHSDRHGFVTYRNVFYAISGAEKIMEKAEEASEKGSHLRTVEICFCIMHEMGELMQTCDDSDGYVGAMIQDCLRLIHHTGSQLERIVAKDRSVIFQLLLKEALHPSLEGWNEWQLSLLESAIYLITSAAERKMWDQLLESMEKGDSSYSQYFSEQAAGLRYNVIQKLDGEALALNFLHDNLHIEAFRQWAIEAAMKSERFDQALQLAEQGEHQDAAKPGLVVKWKKLRYEIYELTGQVGLQIKLAEEFVIEGEYSYYARLKGLYGKDDWAAAYERILDRLDTTRRKNWNADYLYTRVLVEEKETKRLLDYVQKQESTVVEYYPHLVGEHAEEVFVIFHQFIMNQTARSSNRKEYQKVCEVIRHLIKAGGEAHAKEIIEQLGLAYPNRRALIDELQKIKLP